jgi:CubicO group peptidase (beta-lactamase class C family)
MVKRYDFNNFIAVFILNVFITYSCAGNKENEVELDPKPLSQILDSYVENGVWPFLYSRIEHGITGEVLYEHLAVNNRLIPNNTINGDTWMRIWSMSKLITISLAMDLMEQGIIHLQDPVKKYIPEFSNLMVAVDIDGKSIISSDYNNFDCPHNLVKMDSIMTIKHLFNHRAGFYYALTQSTCLNERFASMNITRAEDGGELIKLLSTLPLIQQPGESYFYGMNTSVLGLLLERVTGKSLNQLFIDRIAKPHKLDGLSYTKPKGVFLIPSFTGRDGTLRQAIDGELDIYGGEVPMHSASNKLFLGGEGMLGTAKGYIHFMRLLFFNDKNLFLEKKTIERMSSKSDIEDNDYGYNTGFGSYLTSKTHAYEKDILRVGGYEKTGCWVDRKNKLIGTLFSQANETQDRNGLSNQMEQDFKRELYRQLNNN